MIDKRKILLSILIFSLCLIPIHIFINGLFHIIFMLPLFLFLPGYVLLIALFPNSSNLDYLNRLALSFGLSIAIVPFIGLLMHFGPWGLNSSSIVISVIVFVCIASAIGIFRLQHLPANQRLTYKRMIKLPAIANMNKLQKTLTIVLVFAVLFAIGCLAYVLIAPLEGERYTEFYLLGPNGTVNSYQYQVTEGAQAQAVIGVINHESQAVDYRVQIYSDGKLIGQQSIGLLQNGQKWQGKVSYTVDNVGEDQRIEFYLYSADQPTPFFCEPLWLIVQTNQHK